MGRKLLLIFFLLMAGFFRLKAQDIPPVTVLDGPVLNVDTLSKKLPLDFPLITDPALPSIRMPNSLDHEEAQRRGEVAQRLTRILEAPPSSQDWGEVR